MVNSFLLAKLKINRDTPQPANGKIIKDFLSCPAPEIKNIEALLTVVGGKVVYETLTPITSSANGRARRLGGAGLR